MARFSLGEMFTLSQSCCLYSVRRATIGDGDGESDVKRRHSQGDAESLGESGGADRSDGYAHSAAGEGHQHGFNEDLQHDVEAPGAEGFADADFAGALGDADEHDVHDDDAADDERNQGDGNDDGGNDGEQTIDEAADGVRRDEVEAIGFAGLLVEATAHGDAGEIERLLHGQTAFFARSGE